MRGRLLILVPKSPLIDLFRDLRPEDTEVTLQVSKKPSAEVALQQGLALFNPQELVKAFAAIPSTTKILHMKSLRLNKFSSQVLTQLLTAIPSTVEELDLSDNGLGLLDAEGWRGDNLHLVCAAIRASTVDLSNNHFGEMLSEHLSKALAQLHHAATLKLNNNGLLTSDLTAISQLDTAFKPSLKVLEITEDDLEFDVPEDKSGNDNLESSLNSLARIVPADITVKLNVKLRARFAELRKHHAQAAASISAEEQKINAEKNIIAQLLAYMVFAKARAEDPVAKNPLMHWAHHSAASLEKVTIAIEELGAITNLVRAVHIITELLRRHDGLKPSYPLTYVISNGKGAGLHTNSFDTIFLQLLFAENQESDNYRCSLLDLTKEQLMQYEVLPLEVNEDYRLGKTAELLSGPKRLSPLARNDLREKAITQLEAIVDIFHPGALLRKRLHMV